MVNRTVLVIERQIGLHNWLKEQKMCFVKIVTKQKLMTVFVPLVNFEGQFLFR
jgi:hypothetical protein